MTDCIYVEPGNIPENVPGILHEYCRNPTMLEINRPKDEKPLTCMGSRCGNAIRKA